MCSSTGSCTANYGNVTRKGSACAEGTTYNSETGACDAAEADPCESTKDQQVTHEYNAGSYDQSVPSAPNDSICDNSCGFSRDTTAGLSNTGVKECNRIFKDGYDKDSLYCVVYYRGTGESCTSGGSSTDSTRKEPITIDPTPTSFKEEKCDSWVTASDGSQTRSCTSQSKYETPGKLNCTNAGTIVCSPGTPSPNYNETNKATTETQTTNTDGSKSNSTTTTTDTTSCKGVTPCTSTSKTEGSSEGTNADGTTGDTSSTCTGDGCDDGDSDEEGDEGDGDSPVVTPIVKPTEQGDFTDAIAEWDEKIEEAKTEIAQGSKKLGDSFSVSLSLSGGSSLSCGDSVTILGESISFCMSKFSSELSIIGLALLFIAALISLFIIFKD